MIYFKKKEIFNAQNLKINHNVGPERKIPEFIFLHCAGGLVFPEHVFYVRNPKPIHHGGKKKMCVGIIGAKKFVQIKENVLKNIY